MIHDSGEPAPAYARGDFPPITVSKSCPVHVDSLERGELPVRVLPELVEQIELVRRRQPFSPVRVDCLSPVLRGREAGSLGRARDGSTGERRPGLQDLLVPHLRGERVLLRDR